MNPSKVPSKFSNPFTFQQQQNISLTKQTNIRDPLELDVFNFSYLYETIKSRGLNSNQLKKTIGRYSQNVLTLLDQSNNMHYDRASISRTSIRQKVTQWNCSLRIRLSEMFEFVAMLHLDDLQQTLECLFVTMMETIEETTSTIEKLRMANYRIQRECQEWKLKKKNVLCYSCGKNVQEAKLENTKFQIGTTWTTTDMHYTQQYPDPQTKDNHQAMRQFSNQCKNIQFQLNKMSQQHFFTSQSDHLIQLINDILRQRVAINEKTQALNQKKESTVVMIGNVLKEISDIGKQVEVEYGAPFESRKEVEVGTTKKLSSATSNRILSIKDLADNDQYINKLKLLFSQPIKNFISKYHQIIANNFREQTLLQQRKTPTQDQGTQTSLIKPNEVMRNMEKQLLGMSKEISLLKGNKQKAEKELLRMIEETKKAEGRVIELVAKNRLVESYNVELQLEVKGLREKIRTVNKEHESEKEVIFANFLQEKSALLKSTAQLQRQLHTLTQMNLQRTLRLNLQSKQVQTYSSTFTQKRAFTEQYQQTDPIQILSSQNLLNKSNKKLKTLRSIKLKSKQTNEGDESEYGKSLTSAMKMSHMKSRSDVSGGLGTERRLREKKREETLMGLDAMATVPRDSRTLDVNGSSIIDKSGRKQHLMKKSRKPSITGMIPEAKQTSKSHENEQEDNKDHNQALLHSHNRENFPFSQLTNFTSVMKLAERIEHSPPISYRSRTHKRTFLSSVDKSGQVEEFDETENMVMLRNFNSAEMSRLLSESQQRTKLRKVTKESLRKDSDGRKEKKKVVIRSSLQTPKQAMEQQQGIDVQNTSQGNVLNARYDLKRQKLTIASHQTGTQTLQQNQLINFSHCQRKQLLHQIIQNCYTQLNQAGVIEVIQQFRYISQGKFPQEKGQAKVEADVEQLKNILKRNQEPVIRVMKGDLMLFVSLQEALRYQNGAGLWSDVQTCIMIDTNHSKLTQQIQLFFTHLAESSRHLYNQLLLFIARPYHFMRQIVQQNELVQKQRVLKQVVRLQKSTKQHDKAMWKKGFVKRVFQKIIRVHKIVHKGSCGHVQRFLDRLGFYQFQSVDQV